MPKSGNIDANLCRMWCWSLSWWASEHQPSASGATWRLNVDLLLHLKHEKNEYTQKFSSQKHIEELNCNFPNTVSRTTNNQTQWSTQNSDQTRYLTQTNPLHDAQPFLSLSKPWQFPLLQPTMPWTVIADKRFSRRNMVTNPMTNPNAIAPT